MNQTVQIHGKEEAHEGISPLDSANKPGPDRNQFKLLPWLASAILIFIVLYGTSYLALFWLPPYERVDMRSQLSADYRPWAFLVFQPVDPAIIEEIKQERGVPGQAIVDGLSWLTPTSMPVVSPTPNKASAFTPQATIDTLSSSPTALPFIDNVTPTMTSITSLPEPTVTPQPTATSHPAKSRRSHNAPKPHKTRKPK